MDGEIKPKRWEIYTKGKHKKGFIVENQSGSEITFIFKPSRDSPSEYPRATTKEKIKEIHSFIISRLKEWDYDVVEVKEGRGKKTARSVKKQI